jgi:hypothetical protein
MYDRTEEFLAIARGMGRHARGVTEVILSAS